MMTFGKFDIFSTPIYLEECKFRNKEDVVKHSFELTKWKCRLDTDHGRTDIDNSWKDEFVKLIQNDVGEFLQKIEKPNADANIDLGFELPWINVYRSGDYQEPHDHVDQTTCLSYTYFYKVPKDTGKFIFTNPIKNFRHLSGITNKYFNVVNTTFTPKVKEGDILIFPNWVEHQVTENKSKEDRITISGNIILKESV